ncbi:MAG: cell wall-binding repeat-containing protein [Lachnospiraceae bacterium]|nr:cell wall-binding repeat-containing protein [Lachnospiraceae bacterium]
MMLFHSLRRRIVKSTAVLMAGLLLAGTCPLSAYAAPADDRAVVVPVIEESVTGRVSESGHLSEAVTIDTLSPSVDHTAYALNGSRTLPAAYVPFDVSSLFPELASHEMTVSSYPYVTSVKNQGAYGFCFAFAAAAAMEASLVKRYYPALTVDTVDLSELQLAYYAQIRDEKSQPAGCEGDTSSLNGTTFALGAVGGNDNMIINSIGRRVGVVNEASAPYSWLPTMPTASPNSALEPLEDGSLASSANTYVLDSAAAAPGADTEEVKALVYEHGAVSCWVYYHNDGLNEDASSLCSQNVTETNHEGCIVGWDDNYPKENFRNVPASDGAFLVKNSYGTYRNREGYYWLSYEDSAFLGSTVFAYDLVPADEAESDIFQMDGGIQSKLVFWPAGTERLSVDMCQVFTFDQGASVSAVSFYTTQQGVSYRISLYRNSSQSDPTDGELLSAEAAAGSVLFAGVNKVGLDKAYVLKAGDSLTVRVTLTSEDAAWNADSGHYVKGAAERAISSSLFNSAVHGDPGESYLYNPYSLGWDDLQEYNNIKANWRIKAYGSSGCAVTFDSGSENPLTLFCLRGESALSVRPSDPVLEGYIFDGWYAGGRVYDFTSSVTEDITLTAHFSCPLSVDVKTEDLSLTGASRIREGEVLSLWLSGLDAGTCFFLGTVEDMAEASDPCFVTAAPDGTVSLPLELDDGPAAIALKRADGSWRNLTLSLDSTGQILTVDRGLTVTCLKGDNRYETAAAIAKAAFGEVCPETIILVKGTDFPDALSANALAGYLDAPILMSHTRALSTATAALLGGEWQGQVKKLYVVGLGFSEDVYAALESLCGLNRGDGSIETIGGSDRYATALEVYRKLRTLQEEDGEEPGPVMSSVIVATGLKSADALAVSAVSYRYHIPILLAKSGGRVTEETLAAVTDNDHIFALGAESCVSDTVEEAARRVCGEALDYHRLYGDNRYATSLAIAGFFDSEAFYAYTPAVLYGGLLGIADGTDSHFPDSLAAGQLLGRLGGSLLLQNEKNNTCVTAYFRNNRELLLSEIRDWQFYGSAAADTASSICRRVMADILG